MAGTGTYHEDDGSTGRLLGVVLHLRVPNLSSITDPFVTGRLRGTGFETISLVAYAEGDTYQNGESASCPPSQSQPSATPRGGNGNFSCAELKGQLLGSYKLQYGSAYASGSSTSPLLDLLLQAPMSMRPGQVQ
ncbi:hypothetical protein BAE44_0020293 [Dichanthelium oligosanthes]|uniref:Uncharacterized protein n=1 Tax=Dichanthelium oligosanthes TaxID=888268 RepID=A0A1E5V0K1_9POAL|nr:hypothetical protein BAE44_0020293 [Dichanthelium oligosanthes]